MDKEAISFFIFNDYEYLIPLKLSEMGFNVPINTINEKTKLVVCMSPYPSFRLTKLFPEYKGKRMDLVLDIPEWRIKNPTFKNYFDSYKKCLYSSDYVVTLSNVVGEQLKRLFNIKSFKMFSHFRDEEIEKVIQPQKKEQIISVGRFVELKRFHFVLEALKILKDEDVIKPFPKYMIIGPSSQPEVKDYYIKRARELDLEIELKEDIKYAEVIKHLKESKLCIVPSVFEGQGCLSTESIWSNVPFICADIPVKREFHKDTLIYHKVDDIVDMKEKIKGVLTGDIKFDFKKARKLCEPLTVGNQVKKFIKWYENESPNW